MAEQKTLARKQFGEFICQNPHCQKTFSGYRGNKNHYCSKRCNKRIHPQLQEKICERCGNAFIMKATTNAGRFCSMRCFKNPAKICQHCGQSYNKTARYYCSKRCEAKAKTKSLAERFWTKVQKTEACWLWCGNVNRAGYGTIGVVGTKTVLAHRVSYELAKEPISEGHLCLHTCDNPRCVRPDHLKLGTQLENVRDMHEKQRASKVYRGQSVRMRQWKLILDFYKYRCGLCVRNDIRLVKDHYLPLARGGKTHWTNIWPLCEDCNRKKASRIIDNQILPHVEPLRHIIESFQSSRVRRGVYWNNDRHAWRAQIYLNRKNVQVGTFKLKADAIEAFRTASPELTI